MKKSWPKVLNRFSRLNYLVQLKKSQWYEKDKLESVQEIRLRRLVDFAYNNVQFYHDLFNSIGLKPFDIKTVKDLKKIPPISKNEVQENFQNKKIFAKGIKLSKCSSRITSGSTGTPLKVLLGRKETEYLRALTYFIYMESGVKFYDKTVTIRDESYNTEDRWFNKIGLLRRRNVSIYNPIETIISDLRKIRPDIIHTYPSMLSLLAAEIQKRNISSINPRIIFAGGETMTNSLRNKLAKVFKSNILRVYGAMEMGRFAFECEEHSGYHLISDCVISEFINNNKEVKPGKEGEFIITSLHNYTMPLIRYKIGDIGIPTNDHCQCGRSLPLIKSIEGRTDDFIILPSGTRISPRMINVIEDIPGIVSYKTIQEEKGYFVVKLVKGKDFSEKTIDEVKKQIRLGCLGEEVYIDVEIVKEIPKEGTGKIRAIVSKVQ